MRKTKYCLFAFVAAGALFAEDAPKPPTKKEIVQSIPHAWISEGILCLKARENSLSFADKPQSISSNDFTNTSTVNPTFDWDTGIKIELGLQPKEQYYFLSWCYIQNTASGKKNTDGTEGFFPVMSMDPNLTSADFVTSSNFDWKLSTQFVDFGTMFPWQPASFFLLKSHAGLRIASLNQKAKTYYGGGVFSEGTDMMKMKNNFLGIGPRVGVIPNILLPYGLSLVGEFSVSGFLGRFYVKQKETYLKEELFSKTNIKTRFRVSLDAKAAIAWQKELLYKAIVFSTQLGWEWHEFFSQNELKRSAFDLSNDNYNVFFQGAFLSVTLAF